MLSKYAVIIPDHAIFCFDTISIYIYTCQIVIEGIGRVDSISVEQNIKLIRNVDDCAAGESVVSKETYLVILHTRIIEWVSWFFSDQINAHDEYVLYCLSCSSTPPSHCYGTPVCNHVLSVCHCLCATYYVCNILKYKKKTCYCKSYKYHPLTICAYINMLWASPNAYYSTNIILIHCKKSYAILCRIIHIIPDNSGLFYESTADI